MTKLLISILLPIILFNSCTFGDKLHKDRKGVISKDIPEGQEETVQNQHRVPPGLIPADHNFDGVPPGFETVLPEDVLQKMRDLHRNRKMSTHEKQLEFDRLMDSVPANILAKLPLPPGFETLPENVQTKIRHIHGEEGLNWSQKTQKVHELIQSLPSHQQPRPPPGFPPLPADVNNGLRQPPADFFPLNPPPGFEKVIPPETYQQLVAIHRNRQLSPQEKGQRIDQIMRALPQDIIDQLPLPPGFDQLPEKELKQAKAIFGDRSLSFKEKDRKVFEFVKSLPPKLRRLVRPPLPPVFERLSASTKDQIGNLFEDESLDDQQRQKHFFELINGLPEEEKATVQDALNLKQIPA